MYNNSNSGFSHFTNKRPKFKRAFGGGARGGFGKPSRFSRNESQTQRADSGFAQAVPTRDFTPRQRFAQDSRPSASFGGKSYGQRPAFGGGGGRGYGGGRSFGGNGGRSFGNRGSRGGGGGKRFGSVDPRLLVKSAVEVKEEVFVPENKFTDFGLPQILLHNLEKKGYKDPTPIQDKAIKPVAEGRDVVGIANTGTGKTAAFLLPLITKFLAKKEEKALVIVPTRELASQILDEYMSFTKNMNMHAQLCIGGASMYMQKKGLLRKPNLVIGTPGRLKDLYEQRVLNFADYGTIVLDEVDRMLDMGFITDIEFIVSNLKKPRQSLFFSATTDENVKKIMERFLVNPVFINVKKNETSKNVEQDVVRVSPSKKYDALVELLKKEQLYKVIIFGRTKHGVNSLEKKLRQNDFSVVALHGNKSQSQRQRALDIFKQGRAQALLATDVASRGIDVSDVTHVINYDLPATYEDYVHRIGRTGRAGKKGHAISFVEVAEAQQKPITYR